MEFGGRIKEQVTVSLQEALEKASSVLAALHKVQGFVGALNSLSVQNSVGIIKDAESTVKSIREETSSLLQTVYLTEIAISSLQSTSQLTNTVTVTLPVEGAIEIEQEQETPLPKRRRLGVSSCQDCGQVFAGSSNVCRSCKPADNGATPSSAKKTRGKSVQCSHCDSSFVYKRCLIKHMKENHDINNSEAENVLSVSQDSLVQEVLDQMSSDTLDNSSHLILNESLNDSGDLPDVSESLDIVADSPDTGVIRFDSVIEKKKCGVRVLAGERFYHCLLCNKVFQRLYRIRRHLEVHNPSRTKVQCHLCSKRFTRVDTLQTHLRAVHTDEKPFSCSFSGCERRFAVQSALVNHLKSHLDGKPYQCQECSNTFAIIAELKEHVVSEHPNTKDLRCTVCFKLFAHTEQMIEHKQKAHTLECEMCSKSFAKPGFLKAHLEIHNGPSLFNCRLCDSGFDNEFSYRQHVKTHPKQKTPRGSHRCNLCYESFTDSIELMEHYNSPGHKERVGKVSASLPLASISPNTTIVNIDTSSELSQPPNNNDVESQLQTETTA